MSHGHVWWQPPAIFDIHDVFCSVLHTHASHEATAGALAFNRTSSPGVGLFFFFLRFGMFIFVFFGGRRKIQRDLMHTSVFIVFDLFTVSDLPATSHHLSPVRQSSNNFTFLRYRAASRAFKSFLGIGDGPATAPIVDRVSFPITESVGSLPSS